MESESYNIKIPNVREKKNESDFFNIKIPNVREKINKLLFIKSYTSDDLDNLDGKKKCDLGKTFFKLKYLSFGVQAYAIKVCASQNCILPLALRVEDLLPVKLAEYRAHNALQDSRQKHLYKGDIEIFPVADKLYNEIIKNNLSPHILISLCNYTCEKPENEFSEAIRLIGHNKYTPYKLLLSELCEGGTYGNYYDKLFINNVVSINILAYDLFQILFTILMIKTVFPGFQHRDLHAYNILIRKVNYDNQYTRYVLPNGKEFYLPWFGYQLVISDFGLITFDGPKNIFGNDIRYINSKLYNILSNFNKYCNIHKLTPESKFVIKLNKDTILNNADFSDSNVPTALQEDVYLLNKNEFHNIFAYFIDNNVINEQHTVAGYRNILTLLINKLESIQNFDELLTFISTSNLFAYFHPTTYSKKNYFITYGLKT